METYFLEFISKDNANEAGQEINRWGSADTWWGAREGTDKIMDKIIQTGAHFWATFVPTVTSYTTSRMYSNIDFYW